MPTDRARRREDVTARVLEIGRQHLAEHGAAGLSLRAVTRDLGMVSSAVYRYVANRDELLTLLLVDAYGAQADAVQAAVASAADERWSDRLLAAAHAFRAWAVAEPSRYALLYGSPVPGYAAPPEVTIEPGTRVIGILLGLVAEGVARGDVPDAAGAARPARAAGRRPAGRRRPRSAWPRTRRCCRGRCCSGPPSSAAPAWRCSGSTAPTPSATPAGLRPAGADGPGRAPRRPRPPLTPDLSRIATSRPATADSAWQIRRVGLSGRRPPGRGGPARPRRRAGSGTPRGRAA